jgi:hypothetical protein
MESRASTQLGENIKILTYVSIFFLPITVCTVSTNPDLIEILYLLTITVVLEYERFPLQSLFTRNRNSGCRACHIRHSFES